MRKERPRDSTAPEYVRHVLEKANRELFDPDARSDSIFALTGAVSVAVLATVESGILVATVGSCRCYRARAGQLTCLSRGHSATNEFEGQSEEGAGNNRTSPFASQHHHMVTEALGLRETIRPELRLVPVTPGDRFVLCTASLWSRVSEGDLLSTLSSAVDANQACRSLTSLPRPAKAAVSIATASAL